jgi:ATP-dependent Clp protease ATP-binding subunit ClpC
MSEFMEKHSVSKLIGSPPGYVGYEEGGQLTERVKRNPYSVILLDEIEKAHPDVYNILLQVFEDGQLSDGLGNTIDFKNTIIIMTSNIGARFLSKHTSLGFQGPSEAATESKMEDEVMVEVKRLFNPEFINRLDEIIIFNSLTDEDLERIVELMINELNENLAHRHLEVALTEEAKRWILEKVCHDRNYGARPLRRAIQRYIEDPLSEAMIQGNLTEVSTVEVYRDGDQLWYRARDREEVGVPLSI